MSKGRCHYFDIRRLIPSIISSSRGLVAFILPFVDYGGPIFWTTYLWCGISDMIDGPIARKMNVVSPAGAMVDSIADLIFVVAAAIAVLSNIAVPTWSWVCMGLIVLVRIANILSGEILYHRLIALHTLANKLTGLLVFILPILFSWIPFNYVAAVVIAVALFAAVQEGHFIRTGRVR